MNKSWRCRSPRTFFGLTGDYMQNVYEQFFFLKYNGGWSFSEAYNLPIGLRTWFVERLIKQLNDEKEAIEKAQSGAGPGSTELTPYNSPEMPQDLKNMISKRQG